MARYLIDTNVVDYFLMNDLPERGTELLIEVIDKIPVLSVISKIKLPDAIIAATALANNMVLLTNNEKDFSRIPGLQIINPKAL
ncbi:MAG: hypothetical protein LBG31_03145 [Prevotellaceae bacterium]|jgi:predicted nucleic acid-binding protein|nr:hypothetical protein [Prevotellaceae bacterium]